MMNNGTVPMVNAENLAAFGFQATQTYNAFKQTFDTREYLLVARPGEDACTKLAAEKQSFMEMYPDKSFAKAQPFIIIAGFTAKETMEETLLRWMHRICSQVQGFNVALNNYSGFPPHTIYVRVQDHEPFKLLGQELKIIDQYLQSNGYPALQLSYRPHLNLAQQLPETVYREAMLDYSQKTFYETFQVQELLLLQRSNEMENWKKVNVFRLL